MTSRTDPTPGPDAPVDGARPGPSRTTTSADPGTDPGTTDGTTGGTTGTTTGDATPEATPDPAAGDPVGDAVGTESARAADKARTAEVTRLPWHDPAHDPHVTDGLHKRWRRVIGRTLSKAWDDSLFGMSSQAAFWSALSTAPLLLALLGLVGPVARLFGPTTIDTIQVQIDKFLNSIFNAEVANNLVGNTVETILRQDQSGAISVGLVISLWAGSSAMSAFVEAITIAYRQHEVRHPVKERFFALGLYLIALLSGILLLPLLAIGPSYLPRLFPESWQATVTTIVNLSYYPFLALALILLLTTLYKVAPKHRHGWWRGMPGALLAAGLFLVASVGLRIYLSYVYANGLTYGALATPITFLIFYYLSSMAIIIGAQFNNALLEFYPPRRRRTTVAPDSAGAGGATPAEPPGGGPGGPPGPSGVSGR